jgi:uncharacterized protein (DUF488 family)
MKVIYTIGHSNQSQDHFVDLLKNSKIEILVDVRSNPNSQWAEFANADRLKETLKNIQIQYVYMGDLLGGHPSDSDCYNKVNGKINYQILQEKEYFKRGIERLLQGIDKYHICIMCAEEDPNQCHRNLLIGANLRKQGVEILHIRGDNRIQTDEELWKEKAKISLDQAVLL